MISLRSLRGRDHNKDKDKDKENICDNNNNDWKIEAHMYKGANNKLTECNQSLEKEVRHLQTMLGHAKSELKKKLKEDFKILTFFEVRNSSPNEDHVDIYLEMIAMKEVYTKSEKETVLLKTELF